MPRCSRCGKDVLNNLQRHRNFCVSLSFELSSDEDMMTDDEDFSVSRAYHLSTIAESSHGASCKPGSTDQYIPITSRGDNDHGFEDYDFGEYDHHESQVLGQDIDHNSLSSDESGNDGEDYYDNEQQADVLEYYIGQNRYEDLVERPLRDYHQRENGIRVLDLRDQPTLTTSDYWNLRLSSIIISNNISRKGPEPLDSVHIAARRMTETFGAHSKTYYLCRNGSIPLLNSPRITRRISTAWMNFIYGDRTSHDSSLRCSKETSKNAYSPFALGKKQQVSIGNAIKTSHLLMPLGLDGNLGDVFTRSKSARGVDMIDFLLFAVPTLIYEQLEANDCPFLDQLANLVNLCSLSESWNISLIADPPEREGEDAQPSDLVRITRYAENWHRFMLTEVSHNLYTISWHLLRHLPATIAILGPPRSYSCRSMEASIGMTWIKQLENYFIWDNGPYAAL
ncbi:hypothetical protein BCR43DRAFT_507313 [Syncephalastrum racemosum]|uniref:Uncharacterized protein n=1 Tax=Syncephalastrum racemosum TaxID=13706 RepID=A0A1X2H6S4_SYNRA|nr:hypothetical protein BCR43DRAFT_507313 [Syncephalastrum racemosum]